MCESEYPNSWPEIKVNLLAGHTLKELAISCASCSHEIETSEGGCDGILSFCGHVFHDICWEDYLQLARAVRNWVTCPCCTQMLVHRECKCIIQFAPLPQTGDVASTYPPTLMEGGAMTPNCIRHSMQDSLLRVNQEVRSRLGTDKHIGVTDGKQTCLSSPQEVCFGRRGTLLGVRQVTQIQDICDAECERISRELMGTWAAYGKLDTLPHFTVGVANSRVSGICWNCKIPDCLNGSQI